MPDYDYDYPEDSIDFTPIPEYPEPIFELPLMPDPGFPLPYPIDNMPIDGSAGGTVDWSKILKALGLTTGNSGSIDAILPILSLLAGAYGLNNQNSNTEDAAKQLQAGAEKSNALATDLIGGARSAFTPYQEAGTSALGKMQAMVGANNMADKFGPVGTTSALGDKFKGAMTLKQLMGK